MIYCSNIIYFVNQVPQLTQQQRSSLDKYGLLSVPMTVSQRKDQGASLAKQRSFDVAESGQKSAAHGDRSRQIQSPLPVPLARSYSFMQRREKYHQYQDEDDSMHEKYFIGGGSGSSGMRSVESTPLTRRKYHSGGSSRQTGDGDYMNFGAPTTPCYSRSVSNSLGVHSGSKISKEFTELSNESPTTPSMHRKTKSEPRYRDQITIPQQKKQSNKFSASGSSDRSVNSNKLLSNGENSSSEDPMSSPSPTTTSPSSPSATTRNKISLPNPFVCIEPPRHHCILPEDASKNAAAFDELISPEHKAPSQTAQPTRENSIPKVNFLQFSMVSGFYFIY